MWLPFLYSYGIRTIEIFFIGDLCARCDDQSAPVDKTFSYAPFSGCMLSAAKPDGLIDQTPHASHQSSLRGLEETVPDLHSCCHQLPFLEV